MFRGVVFAIAGVLFTAPVVESALGTVESLQAPEQPATVTAPTSPPAPSTTAIPDREDGPITLPPAPDLSDVDFDKVGQVIEEEQAITRQMEVDEARMIYGKCGEWRELALMIGWPAEEWPTLSYVLHRESRCNVGSHNKTDPMSGSRGLMQINGFWCKPSKYWPNGWLQAQGILTSCDDLYDPETNLRAGLAIWLYGEDKHGCGWRGPWATPCR